MSLNYKNFIIIKKHFQLLLLVCTLKITFVNSEKYCRNIRKYFRQRAFGASIRNTYPNVVADNPNLGPLTKIFSDI